MKKDKKKKLNFRKELQNLANAYEKAPGYLDQAFWHLLQLLIENEKLNSEPDR